MLYLAMGSHLDLWRMDYPPGIALAAQLGRRLFGESVFAIRLLPAIASSALVFLAALLARDLGGRKAAGLASFAVAASPFFLRTGGLFQPVAFDQLAWTLAFVALVRLSLRPSGTGWLGLGLALGFGLLVKFTVAVIGMGIALGLLLGPLRNSLRRPGPYVAALVTLAVGAPSVVGQIRLGFPLLLQMRELAETQLASIVPARFMVELLVFGPTTVLASIGLGALFVIRRFERFRSVAIAALAAFALLFVARGKPYYAGPLFPCLAAAAAAYFDRLTEPRRRRALGASTLAITGYGLLLLPLALPIVPPARLAAALDRLNLNIAVRTNRGTLGLLPHDFADMLGWEERVQSVARVYWRLAPADRDGAVVIAANYGQAGALGLYGPRYGLPYPISAAGTFWHFGPGPKPGLVAVTLGVDRATLEQLYRSVTQVGTIQLPYSVATEQGAPILIGRDPRATLQEAWPSLAGRY